MIYSTKAISVYKALFYANLYNVTKIAFDCGAGGSNPPLYIFLSNGYEVKGIDISEEAINKSLVFEKKYNCKLNIKKGDMKDIDNEEGKVGCCYSYNSIFHMKKKDIIKSIYELIRITEPRGIIYFNLLSKRDKQYGRGVRIGEGEFQDQEDDIIHSYYDDTEIDEELMECDVLEKVFYNTIRNTEEGTINQSFIEYFLRKK